MERITWGRIQNPIRGLLHGTAAIASLVGLAVLVSRAWGRPDLLLGVVVFGLALVAMFTVSTLYHCLPWTEQWKRRMQRIDHSLIFALVAGTFTPIAVAALEGTTLITALGHVWGMAVAGIVLKFVLTAPRTDLSITLQMAMGFSALVWLPWFLSTLGWGAVALILAGGGCYTLGTVFFATRRPRLFPRIFSYHEVFHLMVVAGSGLHFWVIARYVIV